MNDHQPYDQFLRDKLSRLPVPDVQKTWPDMRILLDEEMPEDGRSRYRGGWWFFSAVLIFIIAGSWMLLTFNFSKQNVDPPLSSAKTNPLPPATSGGTDKANAGTQKDSEKPGIEDDKILLSKEVNEEVSLEINKEEGPVNKENNIQPLATRTGKDGEQTETIAGGNNPAVVNPGKGNKSTVDKSIGDKSTGYGPTGNKSTVNKSTVDRPTGAKQSGSKSTGEKTIVGLATVNTPDPLTKDPVALKKSPSVTTSAVGAYDETQDDLTNATTISDIERLPSTSFAETIDSINKDYGSYITYAPVSRKYYRQNKKYGRPANVRLPYTTEGRSFAIGLSLPLVFPLGDQQALSYNVNAGPNTSSDYIPAPHAQYHFNGKVYMQSELQILSPQYIKPALLYQSQTSNSSYQTTNSVSAQKLYYFNVPVSLHYSPFKNFYMGTGLQFSSLFSGVAMHEQQRTGMVSSDSIYTVSYTKFRNDSISDKLSGSEMRLMVETNYYWNKFTVGLRYNQALSNYVSTRAAPSAPMTVDKNKSLLFYLRYNLWEDKKRKNVNAQPLAVK